jgi:putative oxidoreductase
VPKYHHLGYFVRRFISSFVGGRPALGLLFIRIAAGAALTIDGKVRVHNGEPLLPLILGLLEVAGGAVLIAGLCTQVVGILSIALSACEILVFHDTLCPAILLASMGAGLALVGPGAFSLDAWLFGLKRIDIEKLEGPARE